MLVGEHFVMVEKTAITCALFANCSMDDGSFGVSLNWTGTVFEFGLSGKRACWFTPHAVDVKPMFPFIRCGIFGVFSRRSSL